MSKKPLLKHPPSVRGRNSYRGGTGTEDAPVGLLSRAEQEPARARAEQEAHFAVPVVRVRERAAHCASLDESAPHGDTASGSMLESRRTGVDPVSRTLVREAGPVARVGHGGVAVRDAARRDRVGARRLPAGFVSRRLTLAVAGGSAHELRRHGRGKRGGGSKGGEAGGEGELHGDGCAMSSGRGRVERRERRGEQRAAQVVVPLTKSSVRNSVSAAWSEWDPLALGKGER